MTVANTSLAALAKRIVLTAMKALGVIYFGVAILVTTASVWRTGEDVRYEPGMIGWLLTGKPSAATRGLLWPFFLGGPSGERTSARQRDALKRFAQVRSSMIDLQEGFAKQLAENPRAVDPARLERARDGFQNILKMAEGIDLAELNNAYPELGTKFSETGLQEIALYVKALETRDTATMMAAFERGVEWARWYNPRIKEINAMLKRRLE